LFISKRLWPLLLLDDLAVGAPRSPEAIRTEVDRHLLVLRFEGHGALARLAPIRTQLGLPCAAVGALAQRRAASAQALPRAAWTDAPMVFVVCDAIVTRGQPMLRTVAPRSLAMLKIELGEHRAAETWKHPWATLAEAGRIEPHTVVADQGPGVVKGGAVMGLTHPPDVFHLLRPLALCGERFSRKALAASAREYERGRVTIGRAEAVSTQRRTAYEAAQAEADAPIAREDHGCDLWTALRPTLAWCDERGGLPALTSRQAEMDAIVTLLDTRDDGPRHQALVSFASG
jgi:hypothetical protein